MSADSALPEPAAAALPPQQSAAAGPARKAAKRAAKPPSTATTPSTKSAGAEAAPTRANFTPETWIDAAIEVLVDQGIDHVRVDLLAKQLQVTRGSFYWHFRDREELLRRVLQVWREQATEALTRRLEQASDDPVAQLRDVLSLPFRGKAAVRAARIELAIRAWARRDAMARQAVDEADAARIAYMAQVFSSLGFSLLEARGRAFMMYAYVVAESQMANQGNPSLRTPVVERVLRQVLDPQPLAE